MKETDNIREPATIEEIFTGHSLALEHIRAISPLMKALRGQSRTMYVEIYLKDNATLRHNHFVQQLFGYVDEEQKTAWKKAYDELEPQRLQLIERWKQVVQ
jgi:hypothetical protein